MTSLSRRANALSHTYGGKKEKQFGISLVRLNVISRADTDLANVWLFARMNSHMNGQLIFSR